MIQKFKKDKNTYDSLVPTTTIYDDNYLNLQDNETKKPIEYKKIKIQEKQTLQEKYEEIKNDNDSNIDIKIDDENSDENPPNLEKEDFILVDDDDGDEDEVPKDLEEEDVPKDLEEEEKQEDDDEEEEKGDEIVEDNVDKVIVDKVIVDKKRKTEDNTQDGGGGKDIKTVYFSFF